MERDPLEIQEDPHLRPEFCKQESLDEFVRRLTALLEGIDNLTPRLLEVREIIRNNPEEVVIASLRPLWIKQLDGRTNPTEILYLSGYETAVSRQAVLDQQFAVFQEAARVQGIIPTPEDPTAGEHRP